MISPPSPRRPTGVRTRRSRRFYEATPTRCAYLSHEYSTRRDPLLRALSFPGRLGRADDGLDGSFDLNRHGGDQLLPTHTHARTVVFRRQLRSPVTKPTRATDRRCAEQSPHSAGRSTRRPPPTPSSPGDTILRHVSREIRDISAKARHEASTSRASAPETISFAPRVAFSRRKARLSASAVSTRRPFCIS